MDALLQSGERMAILTNKRIIPYKGRLYDKLHKNEVYTSLMTTKILEQMEDPRPYRQDDDLSEHYQDSLHSYDDRSRYWKNLTKEKLHNIENQMEG